MGDHRAVHRKPRVDVQIGGWTVETAVGEAKHAVKWENATAAEASSS
jgi:hypothetical protein